MANEIAGWDAAIEGITGVECGNSWSIDYSGDTLDVTSFCVTKTREFIPGLIEWSGSVDAFVKQSTEPPVPGTVITGAKFYLDEAGSLYLEGDIIVTGVSFDVGIDDTETFSVEFQGSGTLSYVGYA